MSKKYRKAILEDLREYIVEAREDVNEDDDILDEWLDELLESIDIFLKENEADVEVYVDDEED